MGEEVLYTQFNQDYSSLAVGTNQQCTLVSLTSLDNLDRIHESLEADGVRIVERFPNSSTLAALVSVKHPRKLKVCHFKKGTTVGTHSYPNTILAVKLNRKRVVVCLENALYIQDVHMKQLHKITDTPLNEKGILSLSSNEDNSFLAFPGSSSTGQVQVFDAFNLQAKIVIHAHASPLAALAFNMAGTLLATASSKGTVIRVFSTTDGSRLFECGQGCLPKAEIYSVSFSTDNNFLAMSSNTGTVHVFRITNEPNGVENSSQDSWSVFESSQPTEVKEVWDHTRPFASVKTLSLETRSVVAVATFTEANGPKSRVIVGSYDGFLYVYELNGDNGGECKLLHKHKLVVLNGIAMFPTAVVTSTELTADEKGLQQRPVVQSTKKTVKAPLFSKMFTSDFQNKPAVSKSKKNGQTQSIQITKQEEEIRQLKVNLFRTQVTLNTVQQEHSKLQTQSLLTNYGIKLIKDRNGGVSPKLLKTIPQYVSDTFRVPVIVPKWRKCSPPTYRKKFRVEPPVTPPPEPIIVKAEKTTPESGVIKENASDLYFSDPNYFHF